jgi:hypothetical protein
VSSVEHDYPVHVALQRRRRQLVAEDALAQLDRLDLLSDRLLMRLSVLTVKADELRAVGVSLFG